MTNCGAPGCNNRSTDSPDLSFHRLPKESRNELRNKWLNKIKRKYIPKVLFVCSQHFEIDCFERDLKVSFKYFVSSYFSILLVAHRLSIFEIKIIIII